MNKPFFIAALLIIFIGACSGTVFYYGADTIVNLIGVRNGYLIMFLVALFGGVSSLTGVSYAATLLTLAAGGLDPLCLALASGLGISIVDSLYYYIGKHGIRNFLVDTKTEKYVERLTQWIERQSQWVTYVGTYIYTGFTPLPNDVLTIALGITNRKYVPCVIALTLGNMTLTYLIATASNFAF